MGKEDFPETQKRTLSIHATLLIQCTPDEACDGQSSIELLRTALLT